MLKLDPFSDGLLFQCERCHGVGELITHIMEEEGQYYCWNCLTEMNQTKRERVEPGLGKYAVK